ncbi:unknown protein [Oryza sativa Japonica Group]|uniref:Os01g0899500 protein n=2 Tax=Oryza sativa subsp. japonica TaxID=39947 RepID=A0A0P0VBM2_ORYSJ|nr:uncharacterized protein At3g49140 [Oryza sativa Japonica Group]XP_015622400.1 uncharacterized protein At3g49140 [Oryza sativa Japonica Group]XP_015622401.1 uncharacterized protein At3g49140 [Oryza sativa Japonica Group]KAB8084761.1 hypothetical protein EE612_007390 [Oryza sativa]KAF2953831.1 hypothetical protein DAI22_01g435900 [Oryza sativa Japonica Group]BAD82359.1 unknown protein [Oryza sativa Japonica Group]BAF07015.1 Os01g0899500 [Oryza sativa Japonica Group]BAG94354.1 unnamed protei|eukprot:NP_001045101.1 Os01g0899500 [Oryza sativa Japonica Group]
MAAGVTFNWIKTPLDIRRFHDFSSLSFRCRNTFGSIQPSWLTTDQEPSFSKVRVAADYSDSVPDSKYTRDRGYHPLEEVKERPKKKDLSLTDVETARTVVEANSKGLLVFPARVHNEPHGHVAWSDFQYIVDDYGDIFFQVPDSENILEDDAANNPVTVLIGMDGPIIGETSVVTSDFSDYMDVENFIDMPDENDSKIDTEITDILIEWGMPATMRAIHPIYFAKCLTKAVHDKHREKMDSPSNGVSIVGYLRPAFIEEESYLRSLFHGECNGDGYSSDWRDECKREPAPASGTNGLIDDDKSRFDFTNVGSSTDSTIYKLEIMTVELFSIYGKQLMIDPQDFQDAEPDILANSASEIINRIKENDDQCAMALRSLCHRKKGLTVEEASLISIDSLGIDVRAFSGLEARTVRFSFNAQALSERSAEKKIRRMLFPRRKNVKPSTEDEC